MKMMKATPINDFFAHDGRIREDSRMVHDMYLFEVKKPSRSKEPWDDYKLVATIPAEEAFQPLSQSTLPTHQKIVGGRPLNYCFVKTEMASEDLLSD